MEKSSLDSQQQSLQKMKIIDNTDTVLPPQK